MIFTVWYLGWLSLSDDVLHLILPAMAIIVRSSYIDKKLPRINPEWIAFWVLIAAMSGLIPGKGVTFSFLLFLKLALGALLILHLQSTLKTARIRTLPWINQIWFFMSRATLILKKRMNDIAIWRKIRIQDANRKHKSSPRYANTLLSYAALYLRISKIYWRSTLAVLVEILFIQNRLDTVVAARGGFPENTDWMQQIDPPNAWRYTAMADAMLIGAMLAPVLAGATSLVPFPLLEKIESLL